jgi:prepilin-type N-terminal cleavage/methylation domain-containing protein
MGRKGFTLIELMVVMSIIAVMMLILIGILNPTALINRGKDARRKRDLARIRVAFEEYYNDKGCYPDVAKVTELSLPTSCDSLIVFAPWLVPWPCDPDGDPYEIRVDGANSSCWNEYRAYTVLDNAKDSDIPVGWGETVFPHDGDIEAPVNYGVSSPNVTWWGGTSIFKYPPVCRNTCTGECFYRQGGLPGDSWAATGGFCSGDNCFWAPDFDCQIDSCPGGTGGLLGINCFWND